MSNSGIPCDNCGRVFTPTPEQARFISNAKAKEMRLVMLECQFCGISTRFDPVSQTPPGPACEVETFKCPVPCCGGDVSYIDDGDRGKEPFWGCGECGSIWYHKTNLFRDISAIIEKYPHRRRCYAKLRKGWRPASLSRHPKNYDELIATEAEEEGRKSFVRD